MYFKIQSITWNHIYLVARNCWVSWKTANARRERPDCLHHSQDHFLGTACSELSSNTGLTLSLSTPVPYDLMLPLFPPLSFSWCIFPFGKPWESAPLTQLLPALPEGQHYHFQNDCLPPSPPPQAGVHSDSQDTFPLRFPLPASVSWWVRGKVLSF